VIFLKRDFLHLAQTLNRLPEGNFTHCKFGLLGVLGEGLYREISFLYLLPKVVFFPQISQTLAILFKLIFSQISN